MKVFQYKNYDHYVEEQMRGNKEKESRQFNGQVRIKEIHRRIPTTSVTSIICHGTRSGGEQKEFLKYYPNAYVIGTEISDTATKYELTVEHDFSVQKEQWVNKFDIVYSNAIDHAFDPTVTITTWKEQLSPTGKLAVDWNTAHSLKSTAMDPVSGSVKEFKNFLAANQLKIEHEIPSNKWITFICSIIG